jgi:multimeric flavodoxin WrbA
MPDGNTAGNTTGNNTGETMTTVIAINGSPRKKWNTATLLEHALEGAASKGAETQLVHLYDLDFKGCTSCFACKLKDGKSYGKCAMKDGLTPVLETIRSADALILGSPIYFGNVTGEMRSFMERLFFPNMTYTSPQQSLVPRRIPTAFIYTMNVSEQLMKENYSGVIGANANILERIFGQAESLFCNETLQFEDYSKVVFSYADPEERRERRRTVFPQDCRRASEMGARMVQPR